MPCGASATAARARDRIDRGFRGRIGGVVRQGHARSRDVMLMIRPDFCAIMMRPAAAQPSASALTLSASVRSQVSVSLRASLALKAGIVDQHAELPSSPAPSSTALGAPLIRSTSSACARRRPRQPPRRPPGRCRLPRLSRLRSAAPSATARPSPPRSLPAVHTLLPRPACSPGHVDEIRCSASRKQPAVVADFDLLEILCVSRRVLSRCRAPSVRRGDLAVSVRAQDDLRQLPAPAASAARKFADLVILAAKGCIEADSARCDVKV